MKYKPKYRKYIFDIGNVIFQCGTSVFLDQIRISDADAKYISSVVLSRAFVDRLDRGADFEFEIGRQRSRFPNYAPVIERYQREWEMTLGRVNTDVTEIIEILSAGRCGLYALSNWPKEKIHEIERKTDVMKNFSDFMYSGNGLAKPDIEFFLLAKERFAADESTLFIDDREENVAAARLAGINAVQFVGASALRKAVFACPRG